MNSLVLLWATHILVDFCIGIWPIYKTVMGFDIFQASLIAGLCGFIGEGLQLFFGYFCDRGWRKFVLLIGILLSCAALLLPLAATMMGCFFCVLCLMLGSGAYHPAGIGFASSLGGEKKARSILFFASGGALGLGASQLIFSRLHGMPFFFWLILPAMIIAYVALHRFSVTVPSRMGLNLQSFLAPFKENKKSLLLLYFSQVANQGIFLSSIFLLPDLLREQGCHSWLCKGGGHLCMIIGAGLAMVLAGFLADRFGNRKILLFAICSSLITLYGLLFIPTLSLGGTAALLTLFGASLGVINPMILAWGNALVPESPSFVSALLGGMAWCFGHLGTIAIGVLAGSFALQACANALAVMGILPVVNFFLVFAIPAVTKKVEKKTILTDG